jgi:hypothetical protein
MLEGLHASRPHPTFTESESTSEHAPTVARNSDVMTSRHFWQNETTDSKTPLWQNETKDENTPLHASPLTALLGIIVVATNI